VVQATLTGTASDFRRSAIFSCLSMPSSIKQSAVITKPNQINGQTT
jgi:hypothetical protein